MGAAPGALAGLPILLIDQAAPEPEVPGVLTGDALMATLAAWGGDATRHTAPSGAMPERIMRDWLASQPIRTRPDR